MSYLLSVDQSMSKTAYVFWYGGDIVAKGVIRTGSYASKNQPKGVAHFHTLDEQMYFISCRLIDVLNEHVKDWNTPLNIVFEGLSFGSVGNATRNLAGLYFVLRQAFFVQCDVMFDNMSDLAPTTLKAYARPYLPERLQTEIGKTGKPIKVKMTKKLMVQAAEAIKGKEFFEGLNMSTGRDDLADALFLGLVHQSIF